MSKKTQAKSSSTRKTQAKSSSRKAQPAASANAASPAGTAAASTSAKPLVSTQPQSKQQAAVQSGMFLYTNDAWSQAYFDANDLHCVERELFG